MGDRVAKDALFDGFAEVAKALGNGRRAELIDVLAQGERHVEELADEIGQSVANTSFHLRTLADHRVSSPPAETAPASTTGSHPTASASCGPRSVTSLPLTTPSSTTSPPPTSAIAPISTRSPAPTSSNASLPVT